MKTKPSPVYDLLARLHRNCAVCGHDCRCGLQLSLTPVAWGRVMAVWNPSSEWNGYTGLLQGGLAAALLDAAMTHALFSAGITAVTGSLSVRFLHPVKDRLPVGIEGWRNEFRRPIHRLEATLSQENRVCVHATARFMESAAVEVGVTDRARHVFRRPPQELNCAQSILEGARVFHPIEDRRIAAAAGLGRGGAPDGECGALHAAKSLLSKRAGAALDAIFRTRAGGTRCEDIRRFDRIPCSDCVLLAAGALEQPSRTSRATT